MSNPFLQRLRSLPRLNEIHYRYNLISLFSGGGGLDLGLSFAGFETKYASDLEAAHCSTISHNFINSIAIPADVTDLKGDQIKQSFQSESIDLIAGGPPCQSFSILGNRNSFDDPRGKLVYEFARIINEVNPRAFVFENVPGLLTINKGKDWKSLLNYFESETKYTLFWQILNSADFGVPQIRKRVIIVGFRNSNTSFEFPTATHRNPDLASSLFEDEMPTWLPAKFALEDVDGLPNHRIRPHGDRVRERYSQIKPGLRDRVDHTDRINPERPSGTVLVGSRAGGGRPFIHPFEPRHLTVREAARLQSFPDWYEFAETETWQYRAVGNAVPPLLALAIGEAIIKAFENEESK